VLGQGRNVIEMPDHLYVGLYPYSEVAVSSKNLAFDLGDEFLQSRPALSKSLNPACTDSLPKGLGIFRGPGKTRFIDHGDSL
jgi:hypothetical protein